MPLKRGVNYKYFYILLLLIITGISHPPECASLNKVVVEDFKWSVAIASETTAAIDIYHYPQAKPLLKDIAPIIDDTFRRTTYLKKEPSEPTPLFIYISQNDFEQSLIADVSEGTGGVTEAFKNRFIVVHTGSLRYLNHVISHEYTHVIENEILFGGWWKSARLAKFPFYPLWLMEGLAEYSSGDLDIPEREMLVRDAVLNNQLPKIKHLHNFSHLEPNEVVLAYKTSEMLMRFIAREYGEDKLSQILEIYKNSYDASSVIEAVLGLGSVEDLDFRFREWCKEIYDENYNDKNKPEGKPIFFTSNRKNGFGKDFRLQIHSPLFLPDGKIAYISDKRGTNEIWLYDATNKKEKILVGLKNNNSIDYISTEGIALNISSDGKFLVFVGEKNKKDIVFLYELSTGKITSCRPQIPECKSISSPSFSPDGKKITFTAMSGCYRDIFIYDITSDTTEKLTDDEYDDTDPTITPDGKYLIYSSERPKGKNFWDYDLFVMEISTRRKVRLTDWEWDERTPAISNSGKTLAFRGEPDTVRNIYTLKNFDSVVSHYFNTSDDKNLSPSDTKLLFEKITDTSGGCFYPRFSDDENKILYSLYIKGTMDLYLINISLKNPDDQQQSSEPPTATTLLTEGGEEINPQPSSTTTLRLPTHPYKSRVSTDLFFPFIYYSSVDGLFLATYWQFSDILARHNTQVGLLYSEYDKRLNYLVSYTYSRYRPQFFATFSGDNLYYNYYSGDYARYDDITLGLSYPFDRYRRTEISARRIFYKDFTTENNHSTDITRNWHEDYVNLSYIKDTTLRKYLETTGGSYLGLGVTFGRDEFGGTTRRTTAYTDYRNWQGLTPSLIFYTRIFGAAFLDGKDRVRYYLTGGDRVRGYPYKDEYTSEKILTTTLALRFPLVGNINYYMWYLFPDFYFKTLTGEVFIDCGIGEYHPVYSANNGAPALSSWGISVKLYTFILQSYPLTFKVDWAKPFSSPESEKWYFKLSSYIID